MDTLCILKTNLCLIRNTGSIGLVVFFLLFLLSHYCSYFVVIIIVNIALNNGAYIVICFALPIDYTDYYA